MIKRFSIGRILTVVAVLTLAGLGLAACGGDDDSSATVAETSAAETTASETGDGGSLPFEADPDGALAYTETEVSGDAGSNTVAFDNPSSTPHNVVIEDESGAEIASTDVITGSSTTATADVEAGTYTFYCSVSGHREAGMEGTLTIK